MQADLNSAAVRRRKSKRFQVEGVYMSESSKPKYWLAYRARVFALAKTAVPEAEGREGSPLSRELMSERNFSAFSFVF